MHVLLLLQSRLFLVNERIWSMVRLDSRVVTTKVWVHTKSLVLLVYVSHQLFKLGILPHLLELRGLHVVDGCRVLLDWDHVFLHRLLSELSKLLSYLKLLLLSISSKALSSIANNWSWLPHRVFGIYFACVVVQRLWLLHILVIVVLRNIETHIHDISLGHLHRLIVPLCCSIILRILSSL